MILELPEHIDALLLCQGIAMGVNPDLMVMKVNYLSVRCLAEKLVPRISDNGSITIISSNGGYGYERNYKVCKEILGCDDYEETVDFFESNPEKIRVSYVVAKQCINNYVKSHVFDPIYINRRIRINAICPGSTQTGLTHDFNRSGGDEEAGRKWNEKFYLGPWNGRHAHASEMGYPMVAIASNIFSYMSGQVIYFNYGLASTWDIKALNGEDPMTFHAEL